MDSVTLEAMRKRHSVRAYTPRRIEDKVCAKLQTCIEQCNAESGLRIQLVRDEPQAFSSFLAHYGKFRGVANYLALVGKGERLEERCGYYGQRIVLVAQDLGLNSCWVGFTYKKVKGAFELGSGEKLCLVVALGYGETQGKPHRTKLRKKVMSATEPVPEWFLAGVEAALLAPTSMNSQNFMFSLEGDRVAAKVGWGFYSQVDLGIVKYHFELGAGENFRWV